MAAWIPTVKAILPYVTQIIGMAIPAFTQKSDKDNAEELINSQITELQNAVTHNAQSIKVLATQVEQAVSGIDAGAIKIEKELATIKQLLGVAILLSFLAIVLWIITWFH